MNDFVFPLIILPLILLTLVLSRAVTVMLHELGHAIPALVFSKKNVTVYIGSYGEESGLIRLHISKNLTIFLRKNPLLWQKGVVFHSTINDSFYRSFFITLLGPITSFILAAISLWIVFQFDLHGFFKFICFFLFLSALFDLRNIYPDNKPIELNNGDITYCDGYHLKLLINRRKEKRHPLKAFRLVEKGNCKKAKKHLSRLNITTIEVMLNEKIYDCIINKNFADGRKFYFQLMKCYPFNADEHTLCNMGLIESYLHNHHDALHFFNKALSLNVKNHTALCNKAFTFNVLENYEEVIQNFDALIGLSDCSYSYANRGYAKIKLKNHEEGLADIRHALLLDNKSPYAHRNLGVYYLDIGENAKALQHFELAFDLDPNTYLIQEYIDRAKIICN